MLIVLNFLRMVTVELAQNFRWSFLPPLMVYYAAGMSGITGIVGTFFIKEYLNLSAEFLAGLGFWVGIPWALNMPIGHLVDIVWRWKSILVFIGAGFISVSFTIMFLIITEIDTMSAIMPIENWYILSAILSPIGYVLQDVVADAMTVEAVPKLDENGNEYSEDAEKNLHVTMQTLGRVALFLGVISVSAVNIYIFDGIEGLEQEQKVSIYGNLYLLAQLVPIFSISGVILGGYLLFRQARDLRKKGVDATVIQKMIYRLNGHVSPNWYIFGGSLAFVTFSLTVGLMDVPYAQELTFIVSISIIMFLISRLLKELPTERANMLIGTAMIVFVYRATPSIGAGMTWFEIDVLGFDQQFLSVLGFLSYALTLVGVIVLRPMIARYSIAQITVFLSIIGGFLMLPNIGLYYGIHEWTSSLTSGVVDARFIAIFDTALESPLGQVAMIPMLAWIAREAPIHLKATFFAVMASFTNLALSAGSLFTKYGNQIFTVTREVKDRTTGQVEIAADYSELGILILTITAISIVTPVLFIVFVQKSKFQTSQ